MTDERGWQKWRGLKALVHDAVEHGSRAIERVHLDTARRPFALLEIVPGIATPTKVVHVVHDALVTTSYSAVRLVNAALGKAADVALDLLDDAGPSESKPESRSMIE
ncbi:hypothetical protein ACNOYE_02430 [Nannocystaceae bacterium ST9]